MVPGARRVRDIRLVRRRQRRPVQRSGQGFTQHARPARTGMARNTGRRRQLLAGAQGRRMSAQTPYGPTAKIAPPPRDPSAATKRRRPPSSRPKCSHRQVTSRIDSAPRPKAVWPSRNINGPAVRNRRSRCRVESMSTAVETALGRGPHSRERRARRKVDQAREAFEAHERVQGLSSTRSRAATPVDLDGASGLSLPRSQSPYPPRARHHPDGRAEPSPDLKMDVAAAIRRSRAVPCSGEPRRTAFGSCVPSRKGSGHRGVRQ